MSLRQERDRGRGREKNEKNARTSQLADKIRRCSANWKGMDDIRTLSRHSHIHSLSFHVNSSHCTSIPFTLIMPWPYHHENLLGMLWLHAEGELRQYQGQYKTNAERRQCRQIRHKNVWADQIRDAWYDGICFCWYEEARMSSTSRSSNMRERLMNL